ncbi:MAG: CBS domain-containing protein [Actinomycetota bacterium]|nr:CBS domain-containing protein [Actinomycetota bacterium]
MSPRAAWQLEAMGFGDVYDFVAGKAEWIARGLPTEGTGPHYPLVGEVATRDAVYECGSGSTIAEARAGIDQTGRKYCVVLNDEGILMGRLRQKQLASADDAIVDDVMQRGPSTVRPTESAAAVLKRLQDNDVPAIAVTTADGHFLGFAPRSDLERLVDASKTGTHAGLTRRT